MVLLSTLPWLLTAPLCVLLPAALLVRLVARLCGALLKSLVLKDWMRYSMSAISAESRRCRTHSSSSSPSAPHREGPRSRLLRRSLAPRVLLLPRLAEFVERAMMEPTKPTRLPLLKRWERGLSPPGAPGVSTWKACRGAPVLPLVMLLVAVAVPVPEPALSSAACMCTGDTVLSASCPAGITSLARRFPELLLPATGRRTGMAIGAELALTGTNPEGWGWWAWPAANTPGEGPPPAAIVVVSAKLGLTAGLMVANSLSNTLCCALFSLALAPPMPQHTTSAITRYQCSAQLNACRSMPLGGEMPSAITKLGISSGTW
jgi:hypothetical protein